MGGQAQQAQRSREGRCSEDSSQEGFRKLLSVSKKPMRNICELGWATYDLGMPC